MFFKIKIDSLDNNLILFSNSKLQGNEFVSFNNHTGISSDLYVSTCKNLLLKIERPKYSFSKNFLRWLLRDLLRKFFVLGWDAKREYRGYKIAKRAGIATPKAHCWGGTLSPFNKILSFIIIEYKKNSMSGLLYFNSLSECDKCVFIERLASDAVALARHGYVHRDFHLNNFLVNEDGTLSWIDTHFKKLSLFKNKRSRQLFGSLSNDKLGGEKYKLLVLAAFNKL